MLDLDRRKRLASECHELRARLKEWEKSFTENNSGRKPRKEDIKKNSEIAAKYKVYYRTRDVLDGKKDIESLHVPSSSVHKHNLASSLKPAQHSQPKRSKNTLLATPRKVYIPPSKSHPNTLDPYDPPASVSPHPYVFKNAVGPTPQRDGKILGLFDFLSTSESTPSTRKRKANCPEEKQNGVSVVQTPCKKSAKGNTHRPDDLTQSPGARRRSRTPASDGKKFLLSQFFATPTTMRFAAVIEGPVEKPAVNLTPLRADVLAGPPRDGGKPESEKALETTPAFLKRTTSFNQRLLTASGTNTRSTSIDPSGAFQNAGDVRRGPSMRPFKGRALSEILRGLRQMEDNEHEDDMDALHEIEGNKMNVLSGSKQSEADFPAIGEKPARTWKKKGQKRATRRIIMRPAMTRSGMKISDLDEGDASAAEDGVATEDETQVPTCMPHTEPQYTRSGAELQTLPQDCNHEENSDSSAMPAIPEEHNTPESDSDLDELAPTSLPTKRKALSKSTRQPDTQFAKAPKEKAAPHADEKKESKEKKKKKGVNPNAQSHMNFRSLKLRNRNSNTKSRGNFGRGKR